MRLIDADALMRDIEKYHVSDGKFQHWVQIQPTIEPERKKGRWIKYNWTRNKTPTELCSVCDKWSLGRLEKFCPNCGAEMGGTG